MGVTPQALLNRPELAEHLQFYWNIFGELSRKDRPESMSSVCHLPLRAMLDYGELHNFTSAEIKDTWEVVSLIDDLWIREVKKRQAASAAKDKSRRAAPPLTPQHKP
jgi:hypothetical protein